MLTKNQNSTRGVQLAKLTSVALV